MNYYNDVDPYVCEWLENLVLADLIPHGDVDGRSIADVTAGDVRGYTQAHFFCGIAGWPLALQLAGWPADRPIWTGSAPCQPFSQSGQRGGLDDERHLWPHFYRLIRECRPPVVAGEQVASKAAEPWLDHVLADLEAVGYAGAAIAFPSASVGAPHIRDRTYWLGHANGTRSAPGIPAAQRRHQRDAGVLDYAGSELPGRRERPAPGRASPVRVADDHGVRLEQAPRDQLQADPEYHPEPRGGAVGLGDPNGDAARRYGGAVRRPFEGENGQPGADHAGAPGADGGAGPVNGFWRDADWIGCRDGKWRPVEPGTFPLAHGLSARVGRLRAYGNAINAEQGAEFMRAVMECLP